MKVSTKVNGEHISTAEIEGKGHVGVHLNLDDKKGTGDPGMDVMINGYDTNDPNETRYLKWTGSELSAGDIVEVTVMSDLKSDDPIQSRSSKQGKVTILVPSDKADEILKAAYACNQNLNELLFSIREDINETEYRKLARGVGDVINSVFASIAEPIYRGEPSKVPDELKDQPL